LNVGQVTAVDWKRNRCLKSDVMFRPHVEDRRTQTQRKMWILKGLWSLIFIVHIVKDKDMPITGPILQEKTTLFLKEFNAQKPVLMAGVSWSDCWKKWYKLRQLSFCGKKISAYPDEFLKFKVALGYVTGSEGLSSEQNCNETGLNYKVQPSKTKASWAEASAPGYNKTRR
jgi:hypothetical protein